MTGIQVGSTPVKIVGYGCGNDTVPLAVTETKRLMEKLKADVMIGPLSGDEAVYVANYARRIRQDVHHRHGRVAGSDAADRTEEHVPLPRRRRPVERGHRRDRLQEARLAEGRDHRWTTTASAGRRPQGMIADFCAVGGRSRSACSRR
jgi:hypothetical protein